MTTKKQKITEAILIETKHLVGEPLTAKQLDTLKQFTEKRLDTHGKHGYMFQTELYYTKQFVSINDIRMLATYVLNSNHIKINQSF